MNFRTFVISVLIFALGRVNRSEVFIPSINMHLVRNDVKTCSKFCGHQPI